ncbi:MAG: hypothetical protein AAGG01_01240 [Planctomycetota bacterium]
MSGTDPEAQEHGEARGHGPQPLAEIMESHDLAVGDLVAASKELGGLAEPARAVSHKLVSRALTGRPLSPRVRQKVVDALNAASGQSYGPRDAFNYLKPRT